MYFRAVRPSAGLQWSRTLLQNQKLRRGYITDSDVVKAKQYCLEQLR